MDIDSLRTFLTVAENKNFTKSAAELYIAQSTVTNRILELEKELGIPLFNRTNKVVELTREGQMFQEYAQHIIDVTDTALPEITSTKIFAESIRIGCSDSIYESLLAPTLQEYKVSTPNNSIKISIGMSHRLVEQIKNDEFDVVFCYLPIKNESLICKLYYEDEIILVTDHKNIKYKNGITKSGLQNEDYLLCHYALQDIGLFIKSLFPKYHQFSLEIDDCAKVVPYLINHKSYTFLPKTIAKPYINNNILRAIPLIDTTIPSIKIYVTHKKSKAELCKKIFQI